MGALECEQGDAYLKHNSFSPQQNNIRFFQFFIF